MTMLQQEQIYKLLQEQGVEITQSQLRTYLLEHYEEIADLRLEHRSTEKGNMGNWYVTHTDVDQQAANQIVADHIRREWKED